MDTDKKWWGAPLLLAKVFWFPATCPACLSESVFICVHPWLNKFRRLGFS